MKKETQDKLIANYKKEFNLNRGLGGMFGDSEGRYKGKKELMEIIFTKLEVLRFENEARVLDIPGAIEEMLAFEDKLNEYKIKGLTITSEWTAEDVEYFYDMYAAKIEGEKLDEFNRLYERSLKIIKDPYITIEEK